MLSEMLKARNTRESRHIWGKPVGLAYFDFRSGIQDRGAAY